MKAHLLIFSIFAMLTTTVQAHTWTSTDGRTIVADFVSATDAAVTVKMKDGRSVTLPLDKISAEDRTYVTEQAEVAEKDANTVVLGSDNKASKRPSGHKLATAPDGEPVAFVVGKSIGVGKFTSSIGGAAVDGKDQLYLAGDNKVIIFSPTGEEVATIPSPLAPAHVAPGLKDTIWVAGGTQVAQIDKEGKTLKQFNVAQGPITGMKTYEDNVLVAVSSGGVIFNYKEGKLVNEIGRQKGSARGLTTCCGILDFCVDTDGLVHVGELGGHRVSIFDMKGKRIASWGKKSEEKKDFHGCCNPVSIACFGNGNFATSEKDPAIIKIFTGDRRKLEMYVKLQDVAPGCRYQCITCDSKGRIYVINSAKRCVTVLEHPGKDSASEGK